MNIVSAVVALVAAFLIVDLIREFRREKTLSFNIIWSYRPGSAAALNRLNMRCRQLKGKPDQAARVGVWESVAASVRSLA